MVAYQNDSVVGNFVYTKYIVVFIYQFFFILKSCIFSLQQLIWSRKMANKKAIKGQAKPVAVARPVVMVPEKQRGRFSKEWKLAIVLGVLSLLVYANTLRNGYVYDDLSAITKNTMVMKGFSGIPEILSTPYRRGFWVVPNDTYRPLSLVMFAAEYQVFGKNPAAGHFFNILLYAGCVILLFLFLDRLFDRKRTVAVFIAALLFALHPIHTEVVANIKSRDELLCFFFALLSLLVFLKYVRDRRAGQLILGSLCFFFSLLAKETSITFIAIIPLVFLFYRTENRKGGVYVSVCAIAAAAVYMVIRTSVLNAYHANNLMEVSFLDNALAKKGISFGSRIATALYILGFYLKLLLAPYPLVSDYSYNAIPFMTFADPLVLLSLAAYIAIAVYGVRAFIKDRKNPYAFGILFFLVTIFLFSNIPLLIGTNMGERLLFFPSVGFCLVLGLLIERLAGRRGETALLGQPRVMWTVGVISAVFILITVDRNGDWVSNYTLFSADVIKEPQSLRLNYLLGTEMETTMTKETDDVGRQKQLRDAGIKYLQKALAIYPDYDDAQCEMSGAFYRDGQFDSAEAHGNISLRLNPSNAVTLNNMGGIYFNRKEYAKTIQYCEKALHLTPDVVDMYTNVAASFLILGQSDSGISYLYKAIAVDPTYNTSYVFLGKAFRTMGKADSARKYEELARQNEQGQRM